MARLNAPKTFADVRTHEGEQAFPHLKPLAQLRRSVLSCLLWEKEFYEDGQSIAERIAENAKLVAPAELAALAIEARQKFHLRHVPLLLLDVLTKTGPELVAETIPQVIIRADEMGEFLAIYWRNGRKSITRQMRYGLRKALLRFDEYQLGKYDRDGAVKLRDVLRLVRPKPDSEIQSALWQRVVKRTLATPDTWETSLSAGADKKETFTRLLQEGNLGYLALLRNLRNITQAGVDEQLIVAAIVARANGAQRVLPFRYVAAARVVPQLEPALDIALCTTIGELPKFTGKTAILVDVSGSMDWKLSAKSDLTRLDAGAALGAIIPGDVRLFTFSTIIVEVPPRRGMAGVDAIVKSQAHGGTNLGAAVAWINANVQADRLIVITDEQTADRVPAPIMPGYLINVASAEHGIGYGPWVHVDGFSEGVLRFIREFETKTTIG